MSSESSQPMPRTLVIMPAWNEEEVIGNTITELLQRVPEVDLVVVNDGSTDHTSEIARRAGAFVIDLPYNMGVGAAMRTGYKYARRADYDYAMQVDSDGQHDPMCIPDLIAHAQDWDIVIGSRFAGSGEYNVSGPRKWAMSLLSHLFTRAAKTPFTDVTSGFKIANRRGIKFRRYRYGYSTGSACEADPRENARASRRNPFLRSGEIGGLSCSFTLCLLDFDEP